jgi:hypothetical protein
MADVDRLAEGVPSSATAPAMARLIAEATVVAGVALAPEERAALAALAAGDRVEHAAAGMLQMHYLMLETQAWQAFQAGDTPGYLRGFRAARTVAALHAAVAGGSADPLPGVLRELLGTGLPVGAIDEILRDYRAPSAHSDASV